MLSQETSGNTKRHLPQEIIRGAGNLPHCGRHPGTGIVVIIIALGGLQGLRAEGDAWAAAWSFPLGAGLMAAGFVPLWMIGCVERSRAEDRYAAKFGESP